VWSPVDINNPQITAPGYLDAVDMYFVQEDWKN